ncbi:MAG: hypothetical protein IJS56_04885 [Bacilli bacterium]|nr:hypothetical protein [Bacilli bacterium]
MENFAKPSVLKNHRNSFNSSVKAIRGLIDSLSNEYTQIADNIGTYSKKRESIIQSLENKFKKYNLNYKSPLIQNSLEDILKYAEELESQLDISLASLDGEKKSKVIDDTLSIPSDITQIEVISKKIEKASKRIEELESELSMIRIPEKDSKEETVVNFKELVNKKKNNNEVKPVEEHTVVVDDLSASLDNDNISSDIFKDDESELTSYLDSLMGEDNNSVRVSMNNSSSFADKVEAVYGDDSFINNVYNYGNNKNVIDKKAVELGMSSDEVMEDKNALMGEIIDFPTEINLDIDDEKKLG